MTIELGVVPMMASPYFLYQILLEGDQRVYMRVRRTPHLNDQRCVVVVDAQAFVAFWRAANVEPGLGSLLNWFSAIKDKLVSAKPAEWPSYEDGLDAYRKRKFDSAVECFELGIYNPVPLAEAVCSQDPSGHWRASFVNGVTRTLYLLKNGARSFPVECHGMEHAAQLHRMCGVSAAQLPRTVEELTPPQICNPAYVIENGFFDAQTHEFDRFRLVREHWGEEAWWQPDIEGSREKCPYD